MPSLIERAKRVCVEPDSAWTAIAGERADAPSLLAGYVLPLAGAAAFAQWVGVSVVGQSLPTFGTYRLPLTTGFALAITSFLFAAVGVVVMSFVIDALAPTFGAERSREQSLKVAAYSATPVWVAGVLQVVPALGIAVLLGSLYGLYLLYLGLPRLMKCPPEKTVAYLATVVACAIVIGVVGGAVVGRIGAVEATAIVPGLESSQ